MWLSYHNYINYVLIASDGTSFINYANQDKYMDDHDESYQSHVRFVRSLPSGISNVLP